VEEMLVSYVTNHVFCYCYVVEFVDLILFVD
jgi:hypothetical protein